VDEAGNVVIQPRYEEAGDFSEGLAAVYSNGKVGYIDKTGALAIPLVFEPYEDIVAFGAFHEGLARIVQQGKYGFIDKTGKVVIECKFDQADDFSEGLARVETGTDSGWIDKSGKMALRGDYKAKGSFSEGLATAFLAGKYGVVDQSGKWIIQPKFEWVRTFKNGYAQAVVGGKLGFIDRTGNWAIRPAYTAFFDSDEPVAGNVSDGLVWVHLPDATDDSVVFLDLSGKQAIASRFENATDFDDGIALVWKDLKMTYINKKGEVLWQEK
jgi:hypothetical protein